MNNKRLKLLKKIATQEKVIKKLAEDVDLNNAVDAEDYSNQLLEKILDSVKIEGLED